MVIYADSVFVLNALIDYLLLHGCTRLSGARGSRARLLGAAVFGGLYAVGYVIPQCGILRTAAVRLLVFALMVLLAFGGGKQALWRGMLLLGLSFALGGALSALALLLDVPIRVVGGTVCYALDFPTLVLVSGSVYAVAALCFSGLGGHSGGDLVAVEATLDGQSVRFTALRDTGNTLRDPISGRGVLVADWALMRELLPAEVSKHLTQAALFDPAETMETCMRACPQLRMRLIPYRAVGVQSAMLLAVRCDTVKLDGKTETGGLIALSPTGVSDGGAYRALVGGT